MSAVMKRRTSHTRIKLPIPRGARKRVMRRHPNGTVDFERYTLKGKEIAHVFWDEDGALWCFQPIRNGLPHGVRREWFPNGVLHWECRYVNGLEHGLARQWQYDGRFCGVYKMVHGTGHDLWFDENGRLIEECNRKDGNLHGLLRWWDGTKLTREEYCKSDCGYHGIVRWWNGGRLCKGYPQFYVEGQKVTCREYLKACELDSGLPKYLKVEDKPLRKDRPGESFWDPDAGPSIMPPPQASK
jgi:hypothetical protein